MSRLTKWTALLNRGRKAPGAKYVALAVIAGIMALVLLPNRANGQFGLDPCCAIISAGLQSISSLLKGVVATPLSTIQQIQQQAASFEQQVIYPTSALNGARNFLPQLRSPWRQLTQVY